VTHFFSCVEVNSIYFTVNFMMLSDDKKPDGQAVGNRDRDNDTPDTVISSSSPECVIPELPIKFPGMVMNCVKC
jgi:histone-lysine N-methyltransferase MLL3